MRRRWLRWAALVLAAAVLIQGGGIDALHDFAHMFLGTPHERYAARLRRGWASERAAARAWLTSAEESLRNRVPANLPRSEELSFRADRPHAVAFFLPLRRGQRFVANAEAKVQGVTTPFLDLFVEEGAGALRHVGSAARHESHLEVEIREDAGYVLRLQPEPGLDVLIRLTQRVEPTLRLPVEGATVGAIRSSFGASRDAGRREHEGIDIFAARGSKVIAAADGFVSSVGTNRLGGKVVWVLRPSRGEAHYYAHLNTQLVGAGTPVEAGDVIGTVGNTGNARTTAPHLHFGIYGAGGAVDPLPYVVGMSTRDAGLLRDFQPLRGARLRGALSSRLGPPNVGLARAGMAR